MPQAAVVCVVGWSPTALEAIARRGDCSAFVIDSFGTADTAVRVLEQAGCAAEAVSLEHAALAVARSNLVIADALACGPEMFFASAGSYAVAALAHVESVPLWLTARKGTRLPSELWLQCAHGTGTSISHGARRWTRFRLRCVAPSLAPRESAMCRRMRCGQNVLLRPRCSYAVQCNL